LAARSLGYTGHMALGTSLFLIAVGAILRYAVSDSLQGIDIPTIGLILMIVGVAGMVISFFMMTVWDRNRRRDADYVEPPPRSYAGRRDPRDPYA
jgi:cytochrome c oxidase subunit IV